LESVTATAESGSHLEFDMITSPNNHRIKEARKLLRRRERYAQGQVLVEGVRLVRDAWLAGGRLSAVFYAPDALGEEAAAAELVQELGAAAVELVPCSVGVFATLSETVTPQGIAATVALPNLAVPLRRSLTLLLDEVRDPGNAGTLLRSAGAAGVDLVLFGPGTVDAYNEKVMRAGMGAHFRTPLRTLARWDEAEVWVDREQALYVAEAAGELDYDAVDWRQAAVLVVGGEARGASEWVRERAVAIRIPMEGATESLNVAVAGSVILFEAARQRRLARRP
jgi:TrmH family RNA methyltransferase